VATDLRRFHPHPPSWSGTTPCFKIMQHLKHPWRTCLGTRACQRRQSRAAALGARSAGRFGGGLLLIRFLYDRLVPLRMGSAPEPKPPPSGGPEPPPQQRGANTRARTTTKGPKPSTVGGNNTPSCTSCRLAKRRCDRVFPCSRCGAFEGARCAVCGRDFCGREGRRALICVDVMSVSL
jgi:hypothetical protein